MDIRLVDNECSLVSIEEINEINEDINASLSTCVIKNTLYNIRNRFHVLILVKNDKLLKFLEHLGEKINLQFSRWRTSWISLSLNSPSNNTIPMRNVFLTLKLVKTMYCVSF